jgi:hypothetical protein
MSSATIAVLALGCLTAGQPNNAPVRDAYVVVFRYHPALLSPDREIKSQDERQICNAIKDLETGYRSEFSLGRGFEVSLRKDHLPRWKAAIDSLIEDGVLQYYRWGTDNNGYGLVPVR